MKRGKKYQDAVKAYDRSAQYDVAEAIDLVKKNATAKFDETIELHLRTGCDGRHAEQQIRGAVVLPHGTGKTVKVLVFAKGTKVDEAQAAGADFCWRRGINSEDPERGMVRLRCSSSYSGHDGRCRTSWSCTWTEGLNAEPKSWYSYHGCYQSC